MVHRPRRPLFPAGVESDSPYRQDPTYLWRDLLAVHSAFPMHVLIGGGDQVWLYRACSMDTYYRVW